MIVQLIDKILQMTGFEPWISGVGSNRSTNWATTTALELLSYLTYPKYSSQSKELGSNPDKIDIIFIRHIYAIKSTKLRFHVAGEMFLLSSYNAIVVL